MILRYVGNRDVKLVRDAFYDIKIQTVANKIVVKPIRCDPEHEWVLMYESPYTLAADWRKR